jgi:hypothetical protein
MTTREALISKFSPKSDYRPVFLPDLRIWYDWQKENSLLPDRWKNFTLDDICLDTRIPIWRLVRPWRFESVFPVVTAEEAGEKTTTIDINGHKIASRWTRGPDGDWWQTEYPVKTADDLKAVLEYVESGTYQFELDSVTVARDEVADDGLVAIDLPARPFSWLMLEMLGWSEGLMLLLDAEDIIKTIVETADKKLQQLVADLSKCAETIFYSPDNLDGQFVSPPYFSEYLAESYSKSSQTLHENGKYLTVHAGGPVGSLMEAVSKTGIDAIAGICGPPQGDTPMKEAREKAGDKLVLIGGIPQDYLLPSVKIGELEKALELTMAEAESDSRIIISIADHVPIDADISRLELAAQRFRD